MINIITGTIKGMINGKQAKKDPSKDKKSKDVDKTETKQTKAITIGTKNKSDNG
jgi:hypothetical protein